MNKFSLSSPIKMERDFRLLLCSLLISHIRFCLSKNYTEIDSVPTKDKCIDGFGNEGTCRSIFSCPSLYESWRKGEMPKLCTMRGYGPIVCCPKSSNPAPTPKPGDKAKFWCRKYSKVCSLTGITGGEAAKQGEFPHMAAVGFGPIEKPLWGCGGSLISDKFVLTAAHCLYAFNKGPAQWVLLGTVDLENSVHGQTHPVIGRYRHPDYSANAKYNDLALLEIGPAIENHSQPTLSKEIHPVCLPDWDEESETGEAIATGWGRVCFGGETSSVLMKVTLDVLNRSKCEETFYREIKYGTSLNKGIDTTMVCAGKLCGGKDTCQGDSGGPLHVPLVRNCMYKLLGVTSFGNFCGCKNSPGVYMRVSSYLSWIESIVWK